MDENKKIKEKFSYDYEQKNYNKDVIIAGFDEVGRGAIAGPIVVSGVILPVGFKSELIKDSKVLNEKQRLQAYSLIVDKALDYAITIVGLETIEKRNPKVASVIGMETAFKALKVTPDVCLIDFEKPNFYPFNGEIVSLVNGDQKSINIAAASILAKVTRDKIMVQYHQLFPGYGFSAHKGYFTKLHKDNLEKYGPCQIHRKEYNPVKVLLNENK